MTIAKLAPIAHRRWPCNSYGGTSIVITKAKAHFASLPLAPLPLLVA